VRAFREVYFITEPMGYCETFSGIDVWKSMQKTI